MIKKLTRYVSKGFSQSTNYRKKLWVSPCRSTLSERLSDHLRKCELRKKHQPFIHSKIIWRYYWHKIHLYKSVSAHLERERASIMPNNRPFCCGAAAEKYTEHFYTHTHIIINLYIFDLGCSLMERYLKSDC